jgi:hypothetical protein
VQNPYDYDRLIVVFQIVEYPPRSEPQPPISRLRDKGLDVAMSTFREFVNFLGDAVGNVRV